MSKAGTTAPLHASCVALAGRGILIRGAAGSGKSTLALQLLAMGAGLVADDRVILTMTGDKVLASAPPGLPTLIEARGIGLLRAERLGPVPVVLVVDLDQPETARLPPWRQTRLAGVNLPLVHGATNGHLAAAIRQYVLWGREE